MPQKKALKFAAEICLYGNRQTGASYIARLGTGEMTSLDARPDRTFTEAIYMAHGALQALHKALKGGELKGTCRVYDAGGTRCVDLDLCGAFPHYGGITWKPAQVYVLPLKVLLDNAQTPEAAECQGHPASTEGQMGETEYCDGSCRQNARPASKPPLEADMWASLDRASREELIKAAHRFKGVDADAVVGDLQARGWDDLPRATQAGILRELTTKKA